MSPVWKRAGALVLAVACIVVAIPSVASADTTRVRVMTRNLYLGAALEPALAATSATDLFEEAGRVYRSVQETNFPARAKRLAQEIDDANPDLVGLQEVALWRRDDAGAPDGPLTPAAEVVYNFLDSLLRELDRRGLDYRVAVKQREADFEIPVDFTDDGVPAPSYDGRLTIRDVILVERDVRVTRRLSTNYVAALTVSLPPPLPAISIPRGWNAVDAEVREARVRFVNTHLEAFTAGVRNAQAAELAVDGGPLDASRPVVLAGDLNSDPDDPDAEDRVAYQTFVDAGFIDRGVSVDTCCHDADLLNPTPAFDQRIDHVLSKPRLRLLGASLVGADPSMRTPHLLWPSDHGGVGSRLRVRR